MVKNREVVFGGVGEVRVVENRKVVVGGGGVGKSGRYT